MSGNFQGMEIISFIAQFYLNSSIGFLLHRIYRIKISQPVNLRMQVSWHLHIPKNVILTRSWVTFHCSQILYLLSIDSLIAMIREPENKGFLTL